MHNFKALNVSRRYLSFYWGHAMMQLVALQAGRLRVRFPMVSSDFFIDIILPVALWP